MKKRFSRWLPQVLLAIIIGSFCLFFLFLLTPFTTQKRLPQIKSVIGSSMTPSIPKGAVIFVLPTTEKDLKINDIISFRKPDTPNLSITHRVVKIEKENNVPLFTTQGDALRLPDPWKVRQINLEGKVVFWLPLLGYLVNFLKTPVGFILLILLPGCYLLITEIFDLVRFWKKYKKPFNSRSVILTSIFFILFSTPIVTAYFHAESFLSGVTLATTDWVAPSSTIDSPINDLLFRGADLSFSGTSEDNINGTGVLKVDISFDNGATWQTTTDTSIDNSWANWSYNWQSPPDGTHQIKIRATDKTDPASNVEVSHGITITVDNTPPNLSLNINNPKHAVSEPSDLINPGFENDFFGWQKQGNLNNLQIINSDNIVGYGQIAPYSGSKMLRVGNPAGGGINDQISAVWQEFTPTQNYLTIAYNLFSYDYADFDKFFYKINLVSNGAIVDSFLTTAPRDNLTNELTATGWQIKTFDVSGISGSVKIFIEAGDSLPDGQEDNLNPTWVYVDTVDTKTFVKSSTNLNLSATDNISGINTTTYFYRIDGSSWENGTNFTAPTAGLHTLNFKVSDNAGNTTESSALIFTDDIPPTTYTKELTGTYRNTADFEMNFDKKDNSNGSGVKNVQIWSRKDGTDYALSQTETSSPFSFHSFGDGEYEFYSRGMDNLDNLESAKTNYESHIVVDTTSPTAPTSITGFTDNSQATPLTNIWYYGSTPYFSWLGATDALSGISGYNLALTTNAGEIPANFQTTDYYNEPILTTAGIYHLLIRAKDNAGNLSAIWDATTYKFDNQGPTISNITTFYPPINDVANPIAINPDGTKIATLSATVADFHSGLKSAIVDLSSVGGSATQSLTETAPSSGIFTYSFAPAAILTENAYTLPITALDNLDNATSGNFTFVVDKTIPSATITTPISSTTNHTIVLEFTAADTGGAGIDHVKLFKGLGSSYGDPVGNYTTSPITYEAPIDDTYYFYVVAVDKAGNLEIQPTNPNKYETKIEIIP